MRRRLMSTVATVHARDGALLLLAPVNPAAAATVLPGHVLAAHGSTSRAVVLAKAAGKLVAASTDGNAPAKGAALLATDNVDASVARQPPRDTERQVIMRGWRTRVASVDAMVPLGLGQSMLFFDESGSLFDAVASAVRAIVPEPAPGIADADVANVLGVYAACERAERARDAGEHAALVRLLFFCGGGDGDGGSGALTRQAIRDLGSFVRLWTRATGASERGEMRMFYSSLVQRAALLADAKGGGSLTLLGRFPRPSSKPRALAPDADLLPLVEAEVKEGRRSASDFERLVRVTSRGARATRSVLDKLGIPPPMPASERFECAHSEELMSIFDGHIVATPHGCFPLDPRASLTRIGAGSNPNDVRDTRSKLLRTAAGPLRLDVCDAMASVGHDARAAGFVDAVAKAVAPGAASSEKAQAALVWAARNSVRWESASLDLARAEALDADKAASERVSSPLCCVRSR